MTNHRLNVGELNATIALLVRNLPALRMLNDMGDHRIEVSDIEDSIAKLRIQLDLLAPVT
jgi:hypothetical protein